MDTFIILDLASLLSEGEDAYTDSTSDVALQLANFDDAISITPSWCVVV